VFFFLPIPVGMNYRTERWPVVTLSLIALNTLIWLISLIYAIATHGDSNVWVLQHLWLTPGQSGWHTYLTSMFVHEGFFHLLGNMVYLFLFGCCVEDLIGRGRFLCYYLLGGFAAELVFILTSPGNSSPPIPLGGASGAISAAMGMYLLLRANADIDFKLLYFVWILVFFRFGVGEFAMPAWMAIGFWFLKDLFWTIWGLIFPHPGGGTAFGAHVGGLLTGLGLMALHQWHRKTNPLPAASTDILSLAEIKAASVTHQAADPAELPTIYLYENEAQTGPFTLARIQERLAQNELPAGTRYWSEGMSQWEDVQDLADHQG